MQKNEEDVGASDNGHPSLKRTSPALLENTSTDLSETGSSMPKATISGICVSLGKKLSLLLTLAYASCILESMVT